MRGLNRFLPPALLVIIITSGLIFPTLANNGVAKIIVEPRIVNVFVSSTFTVDIWIRDVVDMGYFRFFVIWDPTLLELVSYKNHVEENAPGWVVNEVVGSNLYYLNAFDTGFSSDASWATLTFHCLGEGYTTINIIDSSLSDGPEGPGPIQHEVLNGEVTQKSAVGGLVEPINKLVVLTPYLVFAGLVGAVSTVLIIRRRKD